MKFCSVSGCGVSITDAQADTTVKLFGNMFCLAHEKTAREEANKAAGAFTLDTAPYIKCGFEVKNGVASKVVGQAEITVEIAKVAARKPKKECIQIGGYEYALGLNPLVDVEVKNLYVELGLINKNGTEKPAKAQPQTSAPAKKEVKIESTELVLKQPETALTIDIIQQYICPEATEAEAYNFLQLCKYRDLNPFLKEAYLVKYKGAPATMIVGKDAFTRKAEESGKLDGFTAGILIQTLEKKIEERIGTVYDETEKLVGGWARVKRIDMTVLFEIRVSLSEYIKIVDGRPQRNWATMPATMIRKVALVQALREAFTKELGGCYDAVEVAPEVSQ